jgi:hypothetical protein
VERAVTFSETPLTAMAERLGIAATDLADNERPDVLSISTLARSAELLSLEQAHLDALVAQYGVAIRFQVFTNELLELIITDGLLPAGGLGALHDLARQSDELFNLELRVDKVALVRHLGLDVGAAEVRLYFFAAALDRSLAQAPSSIEKRLWADPGRHLVLAVADTDERIERAAVTILGGRHLPKLDQAIHRPRVSDVLGRVAARRDDYIGWDSALATGLTPLHLAPTAEYVAPSTPLARRLDGLLLGLSAMFICDRARQLTRPDAQVTQVEFRGREHVAYVPISWIDAAQTAATATPAALDAAIALISWCYQSLPERPSLDMVADRLPFVQGRIAQLLENRPEAERFGGLSNALPVLVENARWHWQSFIEGRVNQYLDQVADLESSIDQTVSGLAERTSSVTSKLTETALAAVATLVGALIAAAFKSPFQSRLFSVAMFAYAGYVLAFPFAIGLSSTVGAARQALNAFAPKQRNIAEVLGNERVDALVGERVTSAWGHFIFWAWVIAAAYSAAVAAAVAAAFVVPHLIKH